MGSVLLARGGGNGRTGRGRKWLYEDTLTRDVDYARWVLRPGWAKDSGPRPIDARLETEATNGMFRSSFARQRCVVPMSGYYEWEATPSGKQPHDIHGDGLLAAAGLYTAGKDETTGQWALTFTVITRESRDASGEVHDQMPVFLERHVWDEWLHPDKLDDAAAVVSTIVASSQGIATTITTYPVRRAVNNVRTADPADPALIHVI
ncbi:SOS response-associated peptidase [Sanguibacter suaedae]|uniref:Abasic site processing protein n=1 Tax=Sanguibacter suaedae TaxID=2795737 RepID=A0A934IE42_9MICO|nr:SOS response-associated peptidase [Sanguibacter suaedae]MBI9115269.1 SOS response-associated peptidase [Sanguibacter suaedae]